MGDSLYKTQSAADATDVFRAADHPDSLHDAWQETPLTCRGPRSNRD
jgi:hypothetical protein